VLVKDINPGFGYGFPTNFKAVADRLFFFANNNTNGKELWKSDGTAVGTVLVKDINPGGGDSYMTGNASVAVGSVAYFAANGGVTGVELWKSDGTAEGTVMVRDIAPGPFNSGPQNLTVVGETVFFSAALTDVSASVGSELWKSDGTPLGTVMVKDINFGTASSSPANFAAVGSVAYFAATDGTCGTELWKSDGTDAGTVQIADINPGAGSSSPSALTPVRGTMFFVANDGATGSEPWRLTLSRANSAPVAGDDASGTSEDTSLDWTAPGVLANDTDADGDILTAGSPTTPAHGTVALSADGSFTYTPTANYNGPEAFSYLVSDGWGGSARATVNINVSAVND
ncbi:MAG: cadherin-like domain-containing protein, partial [Actinobacteria bacterium]|nr:cadherin-like domain-containing protein [Actinomycetota bacterium]